MLEPLVMTVPEAAEALRVSRAYAYALVQRGELPSIRVGTTVRVPVARLQEWIENQRIGADAGTVKAP